MPGDLGATVVTNARAFYSTRAASGATGTRHSPRPLFSGRRIHPQLGRIAPRDRGSISEIRHPCATASPLSLEVRAQRASKDGRPRTFDLRVFNRKTGIHFCGTRAPSSFETAALRPPTGERNCVHPGDDGDSWSVLPCWRVIGCGLFSLRGIDRVFEKPLHLPEEAGFRKDRGAERRCADQAVKTAPFRDPEACRDPPALRSAARVRRRLQILGSRQGSLARSA